jgi:hypothetical protein
MMCLKQLVISSKEKSFLTLCFSTIKTIPAILIISVFISLLCSVGVSEAKDYTDIDDLLIDYGTAYIEKDSDLYESLCSNTFRDTGMREFNENIKYESDLTYKILILWDDIEKKPLSPSRVMVRHIPVKIKKQNQKRPMVRFRRIDLINYGNSWRIEGDLFDISPRDYIEIDAYELTNSKRDSRIDFDTTARILQTIDEWRVAWENKNIDDYMEFYKEHAQIIRVTVAGGKEHRKYLSKFELREGMERLNKYYRWINVKITDLELTSQSEIIILAEFMQEFAAGFHPDEEAIYEDLGLKRLKFKKYGKDWRIVYEDWRLYENTSAYE